MEQRVAIVTGGLRGLGRAMTFGLAREGYHILAVGHIDADVATVEAEAGAIKPRGQILPLVADLRRPAECDRVVAIALSRFGGVHTLATMRASPSRRSTRPAFGGPSRRSSGRCRTTSCAP